MKNAIASARSAALITALALGPIFLGLLVLLPLPALYAPTLARPSALALIVVHGALMAVPVWLLRRRLLPADVRHWQRALPVPGRLRLRAEIGVAGLVMVPLSLLCVLSAGFALLESPPWLRPIWPLSVLALLVSLATSWTGATAILLLRARPVSPRYRRPLPPARRYEPRRYRAMPRALLLWHRLFWLPFWRQNSGVGLQQSALLLLGLASMLMWMWPAPALQHGLMALCSSVLLVMLTDRGDKAVREQLQTIAAASACWPLAPGRLALYARGASLLPAFFLLSLWAALACIHRAAISSNAGFLYLGIATLSQLAIVVPNKIGAEGRVIVLVLSTVLLIASGSELWI